MNLENHDFIYRDNELVAEVKVYHNPSNGKWYFEDLSLPGVLTPYDWWDDVIVVYHSMGNRFVRSGL